MTRSSRRRRLLAVAALSTLTACAHSPTLTPQPAPPPCPLEATSPTLDPPTLPAAASFPQPVTPQEKTATASFLQWLASLVQDDQAKTQRLRAAADACASR